MTDEKITNGDFSNFSQNWTTSGPGTYFSTLGGSDGKAYFNGGNETTYGAYIEQTFSAAVGSTQNVRLDLVEVGGGVSDHTFQIDVLDAGGVSIASVVQTVPNGATVPVSFSFSPTTPTSTLRITNTNATNTVASDGGVDNVSVTCFANGTLIDTATGLQAVETLTAGAALRTIDGRFKPLRLILSRAIAPHEMGDDRLCPVRILAGALGCGLPKRDLLVSRQHRVLVTSIIAQRMFGRAQVLVPAIRLTALPGIFLDKAVASLTYYHLVLQDHDVIFAEGAPTETFFPGPAAIAALPPKARAELALLFPQLRAPDTIAMPAYRLRRPGQERALIARHRKNAKPPIQPLPMP